MIKTSRYIDEPDMPNPHRVSARKLHDSEQAQVVHIQLESGEGLKRHVTPVDVCFYVLEGNGVVEIGDDRLEVGADTLVESPARIPHRLENTGDRPFRFLVIKTPRPTAETKLL
ncbi:MAG: cupin domain-containing protein [Proteobacteria bacterium]|nr:cupin domain-containing protein [Pseudomonadota bacterium]